MIKEMPEGFYAVIDGVWYGVWRSRAEAKAGLQVELRRASYRTGLAKRNAAQ